MRRGIAPLITALMIIPLMAVALVVCATFVEFAGDGVALVMFLPFLSDEKRFFANFFCEQRRRLIEIVFHPKVYT